jgi:TRAP-type transport system periplasmic protein
MKSKGKIVLCCLAVVLITSSSLFAADFTIRIANNVAGNHPWGRMAELFKTQLEELTKGKIKVECHHGGTLGKTREVNEMLKMGTLEASIGGVNYLGTYAPELNIVSFPFLWKDMETMFDVLDGPLGKYLESRMDAAGFHSLGFMDNGFRHITSNKKPITSVADLKGLKIRTQPTPIHLAYFKALGASPAPMDWTEVIEALRTGVVDAHENPPASVYTLRVFEVQKYYSLTGHVNEPTIMVMSKIFYNKLPDGLKLAVDTAARKAVLWERVQNNKENQEYVAKLKDVMKVNTVSDANLAEFRKVGQQIYGDAAKDCGKMGKELIDLFVWANK